MALRQRATADGRGPDLVIAHLILVRDQDENGQILAVTGSDRVNEIAEEIVIVTASVNVMGE